MKTKLWAFKLLAVFLLMFSANAWGQTTTVTHTFDSASKLSGSIDSNLSVTTIANSANAPAFNTGFGGHLRMYSHRASGNGNELIISTVAGSNAIIQEVSIVRTSSSGSPNAVMYYVDGVLGGNYPDIITGIAANNNFSIKNEHFTGGSSGSNLQLHISSITITYALPTATTTPVVTASSQTGAVGTQFSYQIQATENPTSYAITSGTLPAGLTLDTTTGIISGTPTEATTSQVSIEVTATNSVGTSAPAVISFTINKGDQTITGFDDATINFATTQSVTLPATTDQGNPIIYSSSNPAIATVSGNVLTFVQTGTVTVTATETGNANYNPITVTKVFSAFSACFSEDFASITSGNSTATGGSNSAWNSNANFPNVGTVYQAGGAVRIGSGSSTGFITSAPLNTIGGDVTVNFDVKGWSSVEGDLVVTLGGVAQNVSYQNVISDAFEPKAVAFTNVPVGSTLTIATLNGRAFVDNILVSCGTATIWDGATWSNGLPNSTTVVAINGNYNGNDFEASAITIASGISLTINGNVTANGNVINNGSIFVNDGGNFIQSAGSAYTAGTGSTFSLNKSSNTFGANKYALWAAPVTGHNYFNMYGSGNTPGFVTTYQTATDAWIHAPADAPFAAVKIPSSITAPSTVVFDGVPNNGVITAPVATGGSGNYNLIGNPYPSNFDLTAFYSANTGNINSTFWFWDNNTTQQGSTGNNQGYATFNAASSVWVAAPSATYTPTSPFASPTQGFIVEANAAGNVTFENTMRGTTSGTFFNKTAATGEGKFWLQLTAPDASVFHTQAITYNAGASNGFDAYDSRSLNSGAHDFYSIADSQKVIIHGRAPFTAADVVALGAKIGVAGTYTISMTQTEGLFAGNQPVYLHDKLTGAYTDLKAKSYSFSAVSGNLDNRFEIVYLAAALAATNSTGNEGISISSEGNGFIVFADSKIETVTVFDSVGRVVTTFEGSGNTLKFTLPAKGLYVAKVKSEKGETTKKIINN